MGKKLKKINMAKKKGASKKALNQAAGYQNSFVIDEMQNLNEESFLQQRIRELKQENRELELNLLLSAVLQNKNLVANMTIGDSIDLFNVIEKKLKEIDIKMADLE